MDEAPQKAIYLAAGLVLALLVVGVVFGIARSQTDATNQTMVQVENMNQASLEATFTQYDTADLTGSSVINAIKKFENENYVISVVVNNGRGEATYVYENDLSAKTTLRAKDAKKKSDLNTYINPSSMYLGEVIRDEDTGTITIIRFEKQ